MKFRPGDLVESASVADGVREFVVAHANEKTSKSGNPMLELELQVDVGRDKPLTVYDRLVNTPNSLWVIRDFCESVSPRIDFQAGELLPANTIGVSGKVHLALGDENPKGKRYMEVEHYVVSDNTAVETGSTGENNTSKNDAPAPSDPESDDIPF